jgi:hypothetical protein
MLELADGGAAAGVQVCLGAVLDQPAGGAEVRVDRLAGLLLWGWAGWGHAREWRDTNQASGLPGGVPSAPMMPRPSRRFRYELQLVDNQPGGSGKNGSSSGAAG